MSENLIGYIDNQGNIVDTQSAGDAFEGEVIEYDNSDQALEIIRHSTAHLMAQAIKELYPDSQFFVGPVVEEGFYYEFRSSDKISEEDLEAVAEWIYEYTPPKDQ